MPFLVKFQRFLNVKNCKKLSKLYDLVAAFDFTSSFSFWNFS
jgi:hypothetical protein